MVGCTEGAAAGAACHFRSPAQIPRRQVPLHSRTDLQCIMCDLSERAQARGLFEDARLALYQSMESQRGSTSDEHPYKINFADPSIENDKNLHYHADGEYSVHVISCYTAKCTQMINPKFRQTLFPSFIQMSDPHPLPLGCENLRLSRVPTIHAGYTMSSGSSSDEYPPTEYAPTEAATGAEAPGLMLESMADVEALLIHDQSQDPAHRQIAWRIRPRAPSPIPEEGRPSSSSMPAPPAPRRLTQTQHEIDSDSTSEPESEPHAQAVAAAETPTGTLPRPEAKFPKYRAHDEAAYANRDPGDRAATRFRHLLVGSNWGGSRRKNRHWSGQITRKSSYSNSYRSRRRDPPQCRRAVGLLVACKWGPGDSVVARPRSARG